MKRLFLMTMGVLFAGCSGDFGELPKDVCKKEHVKDTADGEVVVCDELFDEAPYIHLPKDEDGRAFAGVADGKFETVSGKTLATAGLDQGDTEHANALYELSLDGNQVSDFRVVVRFADSTFVEPLRGRAVEGAISRRVGSDPDGGDRWDETPSLPVRIEFDAELAKRSSSGKAEAVATIANLDQAVTASDGSCLPALSSYGDESTFAEGAVVELRALRVPSMHGLLDDEFVISFQVDGVDIGNLMNPSWYHGPIDLLDESYEPSGEYDGVGHGTPGALPELTLELASDGGGEPCTP